MKQKKRKRISSYERELLREHSSARADNDEAALDGLKVCANINCESFGAPQSVDNFYNLARNADGKDYYCKKCRQLKGAQSYMKDEERAARWRANRGLGIKRKKHVEDAEHKQQLCKLHPHMLAEDCYIGECANRKRDKRHQRRDAQTRARIADAMRGRKNNAQGVTRTVKRTFTFEQRQRMREAAQRRWDSARKR